MRLRFDTVTRLGFFDHERLLGDFFDSGYGNPGKQFCPPWPALSRIGADLLFATLDDLGASQIRRAPQIAMRLRQLDALHGFDGRVPINCLLAAVAAGRGDLASQFKGRFSINVEHLLRWLVLYGINEHRLWHALDKRFVRGLLTPSLLTSAGRLPPLAAITLLERPDLADQFSTKRAFDNVKFSDWLDADGRAQYGLWWCQQKEKISVDVSSDQLNDDAIKDSWNDFVAKESFHRSQFDRVSNTFSTLVGANGDQFYFYRIDFNSYATTSLPVMRGATEAFMDRVDAYSPEVTICLPTKLSGTRRYLVELTTGTDGEIAFAWNGRVLRPSATLANNLVEFVLPGGRGDLTWKADILQISRHPKPGADPSKPWLSLAAIWVPGTP